MNYFILIYLFGIYSKKNPNIFISDDITHIEDDATDQNVIFYPHKHFPNVITQLFETASLIRRTTHTTKQRKNVFRERCLGSIVIFYGTITSRYRKELILSREERKPLSLRISKSNSNIFCSHLRRSSCFL